MERKIGEIFEYNNEWYQCMNGDPCVGCALYSEVCCTSEFFSTFGKCKAGSRSDSNFVIFKKLEKVGEPVTVKGRTFQKLTFDNNSCKECVFNVPNKACCKNSYIEGICDSNGFWVEIKQNKEDMKEKEPTYEELLHYYHSTVGLWAINRSPQKVDLDWICRNAIQLDIDEETLSHKTNNMKPFDLDEAKAGKPVCTRDGRKARIICFDAKCNLPIIALITQSGGDESLARYKSNGRFTNSNESDCDLMMLPEKKEGWVNVYKHFAYKTKEEALSNINPDNEIIDTIKIEWEE